MTILPKDYEKAAFIAHEACEQMLERLTFMKMQPGIIIDAPCRDGYHAAKLKTQYPDAEIIGLDPSIEFLRYCQQKKIISTTHSHSKNQLADLVFSNMGLIKHRELELIAREWRQLLKPGGIVMLSCLGPDSLKELPGEKYLALHDMHNVGDALIQSGFTHPVLDVEHITVTYQDVNVLFQELQQADLISSHGTRPSLSRNNENLFSITFEIIYAHAFVPDETNEYKADETGIVKIPLDRLRRIR